MSLSGRLYPVLDLRKKTAAALASMGIDNFIVPDQNVSQEGHVMEVGRGLCHMTGWAGRQAEGHTEGTTYIYGLAGRQVQ